MKTGSNRFSWIFILFLSASVSCVYRDISDTFDCNISTLAITVASKQDASSCRAIDGKMILEATGGSGTYNFSFDGKTYQTSNEFNNLGPGSYLVYLKDENNCERTVQVDIDAANSSLSATATTSSDSECLTDNGTVTITASGGNPPYEYSWINGTFRSNPVFNNLKFGQYTVIVKDANDCQKTLTVLVPRGNTGVSYNSEIKPIFTTNCTLSGCHSAGTGSRDWTVFSNVKSHAANIKTRTGNKSMPIGGLSLTQTEIDKIACWVDDGANNN